MAEAEQQKGDAEAAENTEEMSVLDQIMQETKIKPNDETYGVGGTLAQYAASGVRVYYICATRGEAGKTNQTLAHGHDTLGTIRWEELKCAAKILGLTDIVYLGYRDSGMLGSQDNKHPNALVGAPLDQGGDNRR